LKILYLNANPRHKLSDVSGYATHMAKTIKGFRQDGHQVITLIAGEEGAGADEARTRYRALKATLPGGKSRTGGGGLALLMRDTYEILRDRRAAARWMKQFRGQGVDFIYERMNPFHGSGARLARGLHVPLVLEINDPLRESVTTNFSRLRFYALMLERSLIRRAALVVVGSAALRSYYVARGVPPNKLVVLYPASDRAAFRPDIPGGEIRRRLGLEDRIVVGFVGSMRSWHRLELFRAAVQRVSQEDPRVAALIVGGIERSEPAAGVVVTGQVAPDEVPQYVAAMDICAIANATWYGSPTKLFEYGAMAKPVVAARFAPIQELIEDGVSGLLFNPGDVEDFAAGIRRLASDAESRKALGEGLHGVLLARATWESNTRKVIETISALRGDGAVRSVESSSGLPAATGQ
jgi:glycosyltransferase involved in cell wall biosynthesis